MSILQKSNISGDFFVQHYGGGIKLVREETLIRQGKYFPAFKLSTLLHQTPLRSFFHNKEHVVLAESDCSLEFNKLLSIDTFVGRTVLDVSDKASALMTFENDNNSLKTQTPRIYEEAPIVGDKPFNFLCFKMPWYDEASRVMGVFSTAIPIGYQSLAETLSVIANLGLLKAPQFKKEISLLSYAKGRIINNVYLTRREQQCVYHLTRGKSAKLIAKFLGLSIRTVEGYIENIKHKAGVFSKYELIEKFITHMDFINNS